MRKGLDDNVFSLEYKESFVEDELLWESHCHGQFEMIAVLEGDITIIFEGKHYRLSNGQCALLCPLSYHTITANKRGSYNRVTALFDIEAIPEVLRPHFPDWKKDIFILPFDEIHTLKTIYQSPEQEFYAPLTKSIMVRLFYEIIRTGSTETAEQIDNDLSQILLFIDAHLCEALRLSDIASHVALSKSSVSHLFVKKMKISPKQYILQKKLAFAAKLIRSGMSATEAALRVGYENYSNFYRMYRKQFHVNPKEN